MLSSWVFELLDVGSSHIQTLRATITDKEIKSSDSKYNE